MKRAPYYNKPFVIGFSYLLAFGRKLILKKVFFCNVTGQQVNKNRRPLPAQPEPNYTITHTVKFTLIYSFHTLIDYDETNFQ